eukprot:2900662-Pyramimonas_sp.AAC.1
MWVDSGGRGASQVRVAHHNINNVHLTWDGTLPSHRFETCHDSGFAVSDQMCRRFALASTVSHPTLHDYDSTKSLYDSNIYYVYYVYYAYVCSTRDVHTIRSHAPKGATS